MMKIKVKCVMCGKEGEVEISRFRRRIKSKWQYFGVINLFGMKPTEYWECPECCEE